MSKACVLSTHSIVAFVGEDVKIIARGSLSTNTIFLVFVLLFLLGNFKFFVEFGIIFFRQILDVLHILLLRDIFFLDGAPLAQPPSGQLY